MPAQTVVDAYIREALARAAYETLDDGTIAASIPDCFGVLGFGASAAECRRNLAERLEQWVSQSLAEGRPLPVLGGVDLNAGQARAPGTHQRPAPPAATTQFDGPEAFAAALTAHERPR
ncbi:MAG TPA: type II toxin-antitoxin system HicB family antitoxin [Dehalococcoidia bacterium]|jgi:predicted RNase H-like HicB family nuclease|nr:type II toxin-antitoxin system HicB family antitoxin [Dehalococcoidia bacterium]